MLKHLELQFLSRLTKNSAFHLSVWPVQPVSLWNAQVLRTGSDQNGPAHGSEPRIRRAVAGQNARMRALELSRTGQNGQIKNRPKTNLYQANYSPETNNTNYYKITI